MILFRTKDISVTYHGQRENTCIVDFCIDFCIPFMTTIFCFKSHDEARPKLHVLLDAAYNRRFAKKHIVAYSITTSAEYYPFSTNIFHMQFLFFTQEVSVEKPASSKSSDGMTGRQDEICGGKHNEQYSRVRAEIIEQCHACAGLTAISHAEHSKNLHYAHPRSRLKTSALAMRVCKKKDSFRN